MATLAQDRRSHPRIPLLVGVFELDYPRGREQCDVLDVSQHGLALQVPVALAQRLTRAPHVAGWVKLSPSVIPFCVRMHVVKTGAAKQGDAAGTVRMSFRIEDKDAAGLKLLYYGTGPMSPP